MARKARGTLNKTTSECEHLVELLVGRLALECQIKEVGSREPLKVLELGSDVCMTSLVWRSK